MNRDPKILGALGPCPCEIGGMTDPVKHAPPSLGYRAEFDRRLPNSPSMVWYGILEFNVPLDTV